MIEPVSPNISINSSSWTIIYFIQNQMKSPVHLEHPFGTQIVKDNMARSWSLLLLPFALALVASVAQAAVVEYTFNVIFYLVFIYFHFCMQFFFLLFYRIYIATCMNTVIFNSWDRAFGSRRRHGSIKKNSPGIKYINFNTFSCSFQIWTIINMFKNFSLKLQNWCDKILHVNILDFMYSLVVTIKKMGAKLHKKKKILLTGGSRTSFVFKEGLLVKGDRTKPCLNLTFLNWAGR